MSSTIARTGLKISETRTIIVGFLLVGVVIAVTAVSYVANMTFDYQWLVWVIGVAFMGVALLALEWPRAYLSALVHNQETFSGTVTDKCSS